MTKDVAKTGTSVPVSKHGESTKYGARLCPALRGLVLNLGYLDATTEVLATAFHREAMGFSPESCRRRGVDLRAGAAPSVRSRIARQRNQGSTVIHKQMTYIKAFGSLFLRLARLQLQLRSKISRELFLRVLMFPTA